MRDKQRYASPEHRALAPKRLHELHVRRHELYEDLLHVDTEIERERAYSLGVDMPLTCGARREYHLAHTDCECALMAAGVRSLTIKELFLTGYVTTSLIRAAIDKELLALYQVGKSELAKIRRAVEAES